MKELESLALPDALDYARVRGLRNESREKLARFRPATLAQAGRIAGVTPADLVVLMVHLKARAEAA
jgi:tRNA uridine 5-carboxymethylaminomethyl modification enzyme